MLDFIKPNQVYLEIPPSLAALASSYATAGAQQRAWMNQIGLEVFQLWLEEEFNLTTQVYPNAASLPSIWEVVNGTALTFDQRRLVLLPTVAIAVDELRVPQEWVDIPGWAADVYISLQVDPDQSWVCITGYCTHQQLKTGGVYETSDRTYCMDADDLLQDINSLLISHQLETSAALKTAFRSEVAPLPHLSQAEATSLIERLGNSRVVFPRRAVPFQQWGAVFSHGGWGQALYNRRQGLSDRDSVMQWIQAGVSGFAQQLGWQRQQFVLTLPGSRNRSLATGIVRSLMIADKSYELRVFSLDRSGAPVWRVELRSATSGGTIPVGFKLRLLTEDLQSMENNEHVATTEVESLYIDVVLEPGESFVWEIEPLPAGCDREILRF